MITGAGSGIGAAFARHCVALAEHTLAAIERNEFWIFPDPAFLPLFEMRARPIIAPQPPPSPADIMESFSGFEN